MKTTEVSVPILLECCQTIAKAVAELQELRVERFALLAEIAKRHSIDDCIAEKRSRRCSTCRLLRRIERLGDPR